MARARLRAGRAARSPARKWPCSRRCRGRVTRWRRARMRDCCAADGMRKSGHSRRRLSLQASKSDQKSRLKFEWEQAGLAEMHEIHGSWICDLIRAQYRYGRDAKNLESVF